VITKHTHPTGSGDAVGEDDKQPFQHLMSGLAGAGSPKVYADKDGLPVTYAAAHAPERKVKPDELSVLWHELLSPLTVIKGYVSTLLELDYAITEDQKKQYLRGVESASNRVIRLLENLRDITRLEEAGALAMRPVSLVDLAAQIIAEVQSQTTRHVIKLVPTHQHLPLVKVDPEKIQQVMSNLLGNAVKYSPEGGDIEVDICLVRDEKELADLLRNSPPLKIPGIVVSIADSGIGIPEGELEHIFKRFYRVNSKLVRSTPGAGLGLYICQLIIEAHGGQIWARNRVRGGSILSFSLPLDSLSYKDRCRQ
jgi:signal transduction histidine kinase